MKKSRSLQEQAALMARVQAAVLLQRFRPKVQADEKKYNRAKQKRHWSKDQDGAFALFTAVVGASGAVERHRITACG